MIGLFQELGPCGVDSKGNVYNNPHSWSNVSNMVRTTTHLDDFGSTVLSFSLTNLLRLDYRTRFPFRLMQTMMAI